MAEEFQDIVAKVQRGEITEETCSHQLLALLDSQRQYSDFRLLEIVGLNDLLFRTILTDVFDAMHHYETVGPYPFNHFFGGMSQVLLPISNPDQQAFVSTFATHKNAHVRALVGNCLIEWGQPEGFSLIEKALVAHSNTSVDIASLYGKRVQAPLAGIQIQILVQAIRQSTNLARLGLVDACHTLKDVRLIPILTHLLSDHSEPWHKWANYDPICYYAAEALKQIDTVEAHLALEQWRDTEFQRLKEQMESPHKYVWNSAYHYGAKLGDARLIPLIANAVENHHEVLDEFYALLALTKFHHEDAIAALIKFIKAWPSKTRTHGEHKVIPTPAFILSEQRGYRSLWEAIKALGEMKADQAVPTLIDILSFPHHPDEWEETRRLGVQALRSIGTEDARQAVEKFDPLT